MKRVSLGDLAPIGPANGVGQRHVKARHASVPPDSLWAAVGFTEGSPPVPRTKDGLARLTAARTTHGKYTKEKRADARRFAEEGRQMRGELKELEAWFVDHGHLDKKWRDWFK